MEFMEMMIDGGGPKCRSIVISGDINERTAQRTIERIEEINAEDDEKQNSVVGYQRKPIYMIINSNGGYVTDGFAIISSMLTSATPIITICLGKAYSMGLFIFAAGHLRWAHKYSTFMYHDISSGVYGKIPELEDEVEFCKVLRNMGTELLLEKTKLTEEKILNETLNRRKDWYFSAKDAIELGIVDELMDDTKFQFGRTDDIQEEVVEQITQSLDTQTSTPSDSNDPKPKTKHKKDIKKDQAQSVIYIKRR